MGMVTISTLGSDGRVLGGDAQNGGLAGSCAGCADNDVEGRQHADNQDSGGNRTHGRITDKEENRDSTSKVVKHQQQDEMGGIKAGSPTPAPIKWERQEDVDKQPE